MANLTEEAKKAIVEKALASKGKGIAEIAFVHNIGKSTLQRWLTNHRNDVASNIKKPFANIQLTRPEQFKHVLNTATLDEVALGAYCREQGLYSFQIQQWKNEFMSPDKDQKKQAERTELKALRAENKLLKKDLLRKDRALAETTALLVLKKKADLLFGALRED